MLQPSTDPPLGDGLMSRFTRSLLGLGTAATVFGLGLLPLTTHAQSVPIASPDDVRARFAEAGYQVGEPTTWWTNGSTTFLVHDQVPTGRVLMVLVYPDIDTAQAERQRSEASAVADGLAPESARPVPGFGPGVWQGNIVLAESTQGELNRRYAEQQELDLGTAIAVGHSQTELQAGRPQMMVRVEADFLTALELPATNL
jgi:hypothetical protein